MEKKLLKAFGANVRRLRLKQDLSQEDLAELADCHRNYIGYVERGERKVSIVRAAALANALKCSSKELFKGLIKRD